MHKWVSFNPVPRKDKKYEVIRICSKCGKQKVKVVRDIA